MDQTALVGRNADDTGPYPARPAHLGETLSPVGPLPRKKRHRALLWSMGGTVLSAVGFVALALFEQYNGMLTELRNDLKHFNETAGEFAKKESLQRLRDHVRDSLKELQAVATTRAQLEQELRASERAREEMARAMQQMRERLAYLEGRQAAVPHGSSPPAVPIPETPSEEP